MQNKLEHYICSARFAEQEPLRNGQVADGKKGNQEAHNNTFKCRMLRVTQLVLFAQPSLRQTIAPSLLPLSGAPRCWFDTSAPSMPQKVPVRASNSECRRCHELLLFRC